MKKFATRLLFCLLLPPLSIFSQHGFTRITEATLSQVAPDTIVYRGASWVDYDNDGKPDLFAAPNFLFRNLGNGSFSRTTTPIGASWRQNFAGSSWADVDNDGDVDCYLANEPSGIYLNDGRGGFSLMATSMPQLSAPAWAGAFGDYNNDGRVDLITAYPKNFLSPPNRPSYLLKNNGSNAFAAITGYAFTDGFDFYTVPYWSDFDLDGDLDLFIASGPGGTAPARDYQYKNLLKETGRDSFTRINNLKFATDLQDGQCYNFIDHDNDGDLDLCLTNFAGTFSRFYKNNNGVYDTLANAFARRRPALSNTWGDFDNDGDIDCLMGNDQYGLLFFYRNDSADVFTALNFGSTNLGASGIAYADYDNDGDLDFYVNGIPPARGLYRNDTLAANRRWVMFSCVGVQSNKSAIGTKVRIKATIRGKSTWQYRDISAQNTFQGQNDLRVHFGLADATRIDSVVVDWLSGRRDVFTNVNPNQRYRVVEGQPLANITDIKETPENYPLSISPNPAQNLLTFNGLAENAVVKSVEVFDLNGKLMVTSPTLNGNQIVVSSLANGLYILKVQTTDLKTYSAKFSILK
jgi:hypothetical protein